MRFSRRIVLQGVGGAVLGLPLLESFSRRAEAAGPNETFAIFFRQANGVAAAQSYTLNNTDRRVEDEKFWPREEGQLTPQSLAGRALEELAAHRSKLLVVGNCNMHDFPYGDGHARGALQVLTARGPVVADQGGDSEAAGESLDHRIGRDLNPEGRDSLFLYAGPSGGWLGGACISYRGSNQRRAAIAHPRQAYDVVTGGSGSSQVDTFATEREKSVNDLVRAQLSRVLAHPRLSRSDRQRIELHLNAVRELEVSLGCQFSEDARRMLDGAASIIQNNNGEERMKLTRMHMDVAVIAVACGHTRSVAIQFGGGNDGSTRFLNPNDSNQRWENFHYISHRIQSHGGEGTAITGADMMHHAIDRYFAQTFRYLVEKLSAYQLPGGGTLLDAGVAVWVNDLGNGPAHAARNIPFILAGSANGFFKQGQYIKLAGDGAHSKMLNTIGTAVGLRNNGGPLDNFGDPSLPRGIHGELLA